MIPDPRQIEAMADRFQIACPEALRRLKCWVLWKAIAQESGKLLKVPFYINGTARGGHGTDDDKAKLATFDAVLEAFNGGGFTGIGIATLPEFGITIGDFDDKQGHGLHPDADAIASTTYAERSPGGKGIHAIWTGTMPSAKNNAIGVEVFGRNGFVTFTGQRLNSNDVEPLPERVKTRLSELLRQSNPTTQKANQVEIVQVDTPTKLALRSALNILDATDYDTWQRQGQRLKKLGPVGRGLWMDWSTADERYSVKEAAHKWNTFTGDNTGYAAVFKEAQDLGWVNPSTAIAKQYEAFEGFLSTPNGTDAPPGFFISIGELLKNKSVPDWLIHGHIEAGALALLFGSPSAGKSFLSLDWSLSVATGREWQGHKVKQGAVCYLAGEGFAGFRRRCAAWSKHNQVNIDAAPVYFNEPPVQLIDEKSCFEAHNAVNEIVKQSGPLSMLVLDTFNRTGGGDENSNTDVAKILQNVEKYFSHPFKCAVLIVHHVGHGEGERSRGASALPAGVDSAFLLTHKDGTRTLKVTKQKEIEPGPEQSFELLDVVLEDWPADPDTGEMQQSAVLLPTDAPSNTAKRYKLTPRLKDALDCLSQALEAGKAVDTPPEVTKKMGLLAPGQCIPEHIWRELFFTCPSIESDATDGAKQKAFRRAVDDLLKRNLIGGSHGQYWRI